MKTTGPLAELNELVPGLTRVFKRPAFTRRLLAELGLSVEMSTVSVLRAVERRGENSPIIGDIAEALTIDASTASRFVDRAVTAGYLERRASEHDRRRTELDLTDDGRKLLQLVIEARMAVIRDVTAGWTADDLETFVRLSTALIEGFDKLDDRP